MIVVATPEELKLVAQRTDILITGVGPINVFKALDKVPRDTPILNIGYAGSKDIDVGTWVEVGRVTPYHPSVDYDEPEYYLDGDIPCYTGTEFVSKTDIAEPCVFDMELAYILAMGFQNVRSLKMVSDNLNLQEYTENVE